MARNRLSATAVAAAKTPGLIADGDGLYLQVTAPAPDRVTRSWVFRYMVNYRARKMGLGSVADFSLAEARERARQARQQLADGIDPIEARLRAQEARLATERAQITFKEAAEEFVDVHEADWRNAKHRQQWRNSLSTYAYPKLGARPVAAIDDALITEAVAPIWRTKAETASRVKQRIERVLAWVKAGKPLPVAAKARNAKHHDAMAFTEIPAFMSELRIRDSVSARALEFTILTAARTGETIGAKWPEIDLAANVWTIPAERMKAGREHRVPLIGRALEILEGLSKRRGFLFAGAIDGKGLSQQAMLELLRGMREGVTVHGFRSSFRDWVAEATNHPSQVAEMALAHTIENKVEKAYRRGDLFEKRKRLMRDWEQYCGGKGGKVVLLKGAASG
ncbi:MAG: tyrosine-type recombinase/integrase [Xanthobacteraceae bacterium]